MQTPFTFRKYGQSGLEISSLFPHTSRFADDLCVIRSLHTDTAAHASGCIQMNTGAVQIGKPSLGAWLGYGLGTLKDSLRSYVVMTDPHGLELQTFVNGERRQHSNTRHLIFDCWSLVETLSTVFTLLPGTVISTGTPSGVAIATRPPRYLKAGDVVRIEIDGLGWIEHPIEAPSG